MRDFDIFGNLEPSARICDSVAQFASYWKKKKRNAAADPRPPAEEEQAGEAGSPDDPPHAIDERA